MEKSVANAAKAYKHKTYVQFSWTLTQRWECDPRKSSNFSFEAIQVNAI